MCAKALVTGDITDEIVRVANGSLLGNVPPTDRGSTPLRCPCATMSCVTFFEESRLRRGRNRGREREETTMTGTQVVEPLNGEMNDKTSQEDVIARALVIIDEALSQMVRRELVSAGEISDLLLDVRNLLTRG